MSADELCFAKQVDGLGRFEVRPLRIPGDIPVVHDWVSRDYAKYWGLQGHSVAEVEAAYREIVRPEHTHAFLGLLDGAPAFLMERYRPADEPVGEHYEVAPGDRGMHVLVAPPERRIHGFTWQVFSVVMDFLFSDPEVTRVVVEPDIRNEKIHALNERAGFEYQKVIELPAKRAQLAFCTRAGYAAALNKELER